MEQEKVNRTNSTIVIVIDFLKLFSGSNLTQSPIVLKQCPQTDVIYQELIAQFYCVSAVASIEITKH